MHPSLSVIALPALLRGLGVRAQHILNFSLLHIGSVTINLLFLLKALAFLILLIAVSRLMQKVVLTRLLRHLHIAEAQKFALGRFVTYTFLLIGLFVGVQSLGINLSSLVIFGGAIGVGVGLGLQNVVSNFVAGLVLLIEQPIRMGDRISINNTLGDVVRIAVRSTWIRTNDNVVMVVPNSDFINNSVTNWTANDPRVRIHMPVGVGYGSDVEQVREILLQVARENQHVLETPAPDVMFLEYGDSSFNLELRAWTEFHTHTPQILKSELYFAALRLFREHKVELPFPQRDLHLRSSDIPLPYAPDAAPASGQPES